MNVNWGGYYETVSALIDLEEGAEEKIVQEDIVFKHLFTLEKTKTLYELKHAIKKIPVNDVNKLNSNVLDIITEALEKFYNDRTLMLEFVVKKGSLPAVKFLMEREQFVIESSFFLAIQFGHLNIVKFLAGKISYNFTPDALVIAVKYNHTEIVNFLISTQAPLLPNILDYLLYDNIEVVKALFFYATHFDKVLILDKAFEKSLRNNFRDISKFYIENNVKIVLEHLLIAIGNQDLEIIELLLKQNCFLVEDKSVIKHAIIVFNKKIIELLLQYGLNLNSIDDHVITNLINNKSNIIIEFLLEKGYKLKFTEINQIFESNNIELLEILKFKYNIDKPVQILPTYNFSGRDIHKTEPCLRAGSSVLQVIGSFLKNY